MEDREAEAERIENLLIEKGIMIPMEDLVHYMTRNASYMRLINSQQFKDSDIDLEEILDNDFIKDQFEKNGETAKMMRFVTEKIVAIMQETEKVMEPIEDLQPELVGLEDSKEE